MVTKSSALILKKYESKLETKLKKKLKHIGLSKLHIDNPDKLKLLGGYAVSGLTTGAALGGASTGIGVLPAAAIGTGIGLLSGAIYIGYTNHIAKQALKAETVIEKVKLKTFEDIEKMSKADKAHLIGAVAKLLAAETIAANKEILLGLHYGLITKHVVVTELANRVINALNKEDVTKDDYVDHIKSTKGTQIFHKQIPMPVKTVDNKVVNFAKLLEQSVIAQDYQHTAAKEQSIANPHTFFKPQQPVSTLEEKKAQSCPKLDYDYHEPVSKLSC